MGLFSSRNSSEGLEGVVSEYSLENNPKHISYYDAKNLIQTEISKYQDQFEGTEFPELKIEKKENEISVDYRLSKDTNLYDTIKIFASKVGKAEVTTSLSSIYFAYNDERVFIHEDTYFGHSISITKRNDFTPEEIDAIVETYIAGNKQKNKQKSPKERLKELGIEVYDSNQKFSWDDIAGYDEVKQEIKDTVILPLQNPEIYENIAKGTRVRYESVRPKAVLFEGPPGTGKTTTARIIANESESSMIYVPVESIMTKWYGESERNLSCIFSSAQDIGNSIIFLDEIDSLATSRENDLHEASRRVLSVLLRKIDGFDPNDNTLLIGATNRKEDLDPALLSRFDLSVNFPLPNLEERVGIFTSYAKQLSNDELKQLADLSKGMSGRNIKDVCEHSERRWASKRIREIVNEELPNIDEYIQSISSRQNSKI